MPRFGLPGERIGYKVYPNANGAPPLVLVHGFTASSASFAANIPALRERFTVITVDLLGHGESEAPDETAPYAPGPAIARIRGLLDHLGYEKVLLCGHSLGAAVCLRLALDEPQRLAGLILINSMSAAGTPEWRDSARAGMNEMAARLREEGSEFLRKTRLYPAHSKRLDPQSRQLLTDAFDQAPPEGLAGTAEGLVVDINSYERLGELRVETLLVVGLKEEAFAKAVPDFVDRMPEGLVREVHLEHAGHAANLEQPEAFESAVTAFAQELGYITTLKVADAERPNGNVLTALGAVLVIGGIALLAGSFIFVRGGDGGGTTAATADDRDPTAAATATATSSAVSLVAGTRSPGASATAALAQTATAGPGGAATAPASTATPVPQATAATAVATATPRPATATPEATATPAASATPSASPRATATATPSGPAARVSGPASAALNAPVSFIGDGSGGVVTTMQWSATGGEVSTFNRFAPTVRFTQAGCQTVSVTVIFSNGVTKTASTRVAAGGATCP